MADADRLEPQASWYGNQQLQDRKVWYSSVAEIYNQVRPRYPSVIIQHAIDEIRPESIATPLPGRILEIGCGPGIATVALAEHGFSILALEPSGEAALLAQRNCARFPQVTILNQALEEWEPTQAGGFDAVVAATSIHWIPAEVAYPKVAIALKPSGTLILLWNMTMQPALNLYERFRPVYAEFAPNLGIYETRETQEASLKELGQVAIASGYFGDLTTKIVACTATYTIDDYLGLLNTYSPYLKMPSQARADLFAGLRAVIQQEVGEKLELHYLSAAQVMRKR